MWDGPFHFLLCKAVLLMYILNKRSNFYVPFTCVSLVSLICVLECTACVIWSLVLIFRSCYATLFLSFHTGKSRKILENTGISCWNFDGHPVIHFGNIWSLRSITNDSQKLLVKKYFFQGFVLKQNSTQTLLAGVSNNFGFKHRMKIQQTL